MELNTIDGTKINCENLLSYTSVEYSFIRIPVTGHVTNEVADVVSTKVIPGFLPHTLYEKIVRSN